MSVLSARPGVAGWAGVSKKESPLDFKKILLESVYQCFSVRFREIRPIRVQESRQLLKTQFAEKNRGTFFWYNLPP